MFTKQRLIASCAFCIALSVFWFAPDLVGLVGTGGLVWAAVPQICVPLAAALFCASAAVRSSDSDRTAWTHFAVGSSLYVAGNLGYLAYAAAGVTPSFPALPEAAYFAMACCFAAGMFHFLKVKDNISRIQFYNFIIICCSVTLTSLFFLNGSISASVMNPVGTTIAFLYPITWFSVAAFGLISAFLYDTRDKTFPLALLLLGMFAEAIGDIAYGIALMDGSYQPGGMIQLLWVASAGLFLWAATDRLQQLRHSAASSTAVIKRNNDHALVQAITPAAAIAMVLLAGIFTNSLGETPYVVAASTLALVLALLAGLREHYVVETQRRLRRAVDRGQVDLARSEYRLTTVLQSTTDSVIVVDRDWRIEFFNEHATAAPNQGRLLQIGANFWEVFPLADTGELGRLYRGAAETQQPAEFEYYVESMDSWLEITVNPTPEGLSIFHRDISERRRVREHIAHLAHHDPLTGLANRTLFRERLREAVDSGAQVATLLLDLDHFKEVNDTFGHPVGDALLVAIGERLRTCLRPTDTIARLGGDEFAIILTDPDQTLDVALLARRIVGVASAAYDIGGQSVRVGASLGIAQSGSGSDDPDTIFKNADIALYAAKAEAPGEYRFFELAMETEVQQRQALRVDLRAALDNGEFELAYQPLVDLEFNRVCGFEALLRWRHPVRGMVSPEIFIPVAEETGLIVPIGDWVLETACREAAKWPSHLSVAVNLSTRQFASSDLVDKIEAMLQRIGFDRNRLELEITETVLLKDSIANLMTLQRLRSLGIRIALDDFGTGYSSLGYLQRFPFSKIKIDRSFVSGLPGNEESQAIVRAVIGLGQTLGIRVTAEGVETQEQFDWIKCGCDEAQGYFLSRPVAAREVPGLLRSLGGKLDEGRHHSRMAS